MFSIVIPLYNKEKFAAHAVNSVLNQTFTNFEVIIVNDGSTDSSLAVVESIEDNRLRILTIPNSGVSVARNTGIASAKFDWIGFLDADDWWAPTFLEEIFNAIRNHSSRAIFAAGRSRVFNNFTERYNNDYLPDEGAIGEVNYIQVISRFLPVINASNVVIRKDLFKKKGMFKPGLRQHEDHDLWLRLCLNEPVVFINKELSFYRKTENDSASKAIYKARDFVVYLDTMLEVREKLTKTDLKYFNNYVNGFVFLTYIKYYWHYSKAERKTVFELVKRLLNGTKTMLLILCNSMPFNLYPLLKAIRS